jgi:hypothetical protein
LSAALRKHLIWLESLPPQTCEQWRPLWRVSDGSLERGLTLGRDLQPIRISPSPDFGANALADTPWVAGLEHFVDGLRNARVVEERARPAQANGRNPDIGHAK